MNMPIQVMVKVVMFCAVCTKLKLLLNLSKLLLPILKMKMSS